MQFPESWLREFCNPPLSTSALCDALTMAGMEVEEARPAAPAFTGVVVGEIKEAVQHPNADRLRVCQVDVGDGALRNIVCGAPNARAGIRVPCALPGAELPTGVADKPFVIQIGKLRGVESQGMLCSASELGIDEDASGLLELASDAPLGQNIREYLKLDDTLITVKLTPNLGHCLSVYGIARELSAITGAPLHSPEIKAVAATSNDVLPVHIEASDLCGRFSGRVVKGLNTQAKTPAWMRERLARCGQRSVSALVDISNYVMFEYGRPSHIFDFDKIQGALHVRWGRSGESLKLLNGNTIEVDETVGVIADDHAVESLAGIMGGDSTAVGDTTCNVYIEAAFWWPEAVQGRSRRFNFSTDAGHRFERGVDPEHTVAHIERITQLVLDICGTPETQVGPMDDHKPAMPKREAVSLRVARAAKVLGMPISAQQCVDALARLGLKPVLSADAQRITVTPPGYRFDIRIEEDLIEEIARIHGFDHLPSSSPIAPITSLPRSEVTRSRFALRHAMAALGYFETINYSFVEESWERDLAGNSDSIRLLNPIAAQMSVMRSSLIGNLLQVLKRNLDRKVSRVRVFEWGRVFVRDAAALDGPFGVKGISQPMRLGGLAYGTADALQWGEKARTVDFFDVKGDLEALLAPAPISFVAAEHPAMHPGRCAAVMLAGQSIGHIGELHPKWRQAWDLPQAPIVFELDAAAIQARDLAAPKPVPKFQPVERDLALVVADTVSHDALIAAIRAGGGAVVTDAKLFDVFKPKGETAGMAANEKSCAVRLTLESAEATLTEEQIEAAVQQVLQSANAKVGARLRT